MLTIQVHSEGATERLELAARSFRELRPVFNMFAAWLREDVQRVFDTEGEGTWPKRQNEGTASQQQRIAANVARIEANKYRSLQGSLRSSRAKAERRLQRTTDSKLLTRRQRERCAIRCAAGRGSASRRRRNSTARGTEKAVRPASATGSIGPKADSKSARGETSGGHFVKSALRGRLGLFPYVLAHSLGVCPQRRRNWRKRRAGTEAHVLEWTPARIRKFVEMANTYLADKAAKKAAK